MMQPGTRDILAKIRALLDRYPGAAALGELSSQPGALERVHAVTAGDRLLHMAYTLRPLRGGFDWASVRGLIRDAATDGAGWPCWSFSNHDTERAATRWHPRGAAAGHDPDFARLLLTLLLSLRGSICLYQGEELGLPEADLAFADLRDPFGITFFPEFRGRDGARTPMPWNAAAPHAGFSTAPPWLPVPEAHRPLAVDAQDARPDSVLAAVRDFLRWRRAQPAMRVGTIAMLDLPEPLVGFTRSHDGAEIVCVFNLADAPVTLDADWLRPLPDSGGSDSLALPRFGVLIAEPNASRHRNIAAA